MVLSASLPVQSGAFAPARSAPFFEGLLPEGAVRASIARSFHLSEEDGFGLLKALGADCAGAVTLLPPDVEPGLRRGKEGPNLFGDELGRLIEELPQHPLGIDLKPDGVRLSLGGIQPKLVLAGSFAIHGIVGGRILTGFCQPLDGAPSTCLLKPESGEYEYLVANEAFCMGIARSVGLEAAETDMIEIGATPCLYAERFDRMRDGLLVTRVHQEDMCQALGMLPAAKYEENGGPSVAVIVDLLRRLRGPRMARDINDFIHAVLINFLLGNSDAHGKNFALLYSLDSGIRLAPLYDIVSTAVYPDVTDRMAMAIGGEVDPGQVDLAAWGRLAEECGLGGGVAAVVRRRAEATVRVVERHREIVIDNGRYRPVVDAIVEVCRKRAAQLTGG